MRQGVVLQTVRYSTIQWKNNIKLLQSKRANIVKDAVFHTESITVRGKECSGHNKLNDK